MTRKPGLLAVFEMRLGGPHQEGRDVARILVDRLRAAVVIGHLVVRQRRGHGQRLAGDEIGIVVGAFGDLHAGRRLSS